MRKEITPIRLKILYCILKMEEEKVTAAKIAEGLHIAKSTVTRAVEYFQSVDILEKHRMMFTCYGREQIEKYTKYKNGIVEWLEENSSLTAEEIHEEALQMLVSLKEETIKAYENVSKGGQKGCLFCDIEGFCEKCIDYLLEDGEYDISFTIYKDNTKKHMSVSMANAGFHHPGTLIVKNGVGTIRLIGKKVVRPVPVGKGMLVGQVQRMSYLMNHRYETAVSDGTYWMFPAACMKFTYNKGEGILMGSTSLKMSSSVGKMYMPESDALFTMILVIK